MAHGPVPRSHEHDLPKRVRRLGLQCALSAKAWERRLLVVDSLQPAEPKTVGRSRLPVDRHCLGRRMGLVAAAATRQLAAPCLLKA